MHNCENHVCDVSPDDSKLVEVQLRQADCREAIRSMIFHECDNDRLPVGRTSFRNDEAYISDGMNGHCVNREDVCIADMRLPLGQSV
jgi:hypothetical protein